MTFFRAVVRQHPHWLNRGVWLLCGKYFPIAGTFMIQRRHDWTLPSYYLINCLIHKIHSISTVLNASQSQLGYWSQPERSFINNNKFHMMNWMIQYDKKPQHWKSSDWWGFSLVSIISTVYSIQVCRAQGEWRKHSFIFIFIFMTCCKVFT